MNQSNKIIDELKDNPEVDAAFITGSNAGAESKPYSDLDLVVILKSNKDKIGAAYLWIEEKFADGFFFDLEDLNRLSVSERVDWNSLDGILLSWLKRGEIKFDHSGSLTNLKSKADKLEEVGVSDKEKNSFWQKINYNLVANQRYFNSSDPLYLEALELRLLYSVMELVCGYLALRDVPWRGEKAAISYLKQSAPEFYSILISYYKAINIDERFKFYLQLTELVLPPPYKIWTKADKIFVAKDGSIMSLAEGLWKE